MKRSIDLDGTKKSMSMPLPMKKKSLKDYLRWVNVIKTKQDLETTKKIKKKSFVSIVFVKEKGSSCTQTAHETTYYESKNHPKYECKVKQNQHKRHFAKRYFNTHKEKQVKTFYHRNSINLTFSQRLNELMNQIGRLKSQLNYHANKSKSNYYVAKKTFHQLNFNDTKSQGFGGIPRYRWVPKVRPLDNP